MFVESRTVNKRFNSKYKKNKKTGCWDWVGGMRTNGYGAMSIGYRKEATKVGFKYIAHTRTAHRISYEIHKGSIPDGLYVCHTCDNKRCVNPKHLWLGTPKDNMVDMSKKGRSLKGRTGMKSKNCGSAQHLSKLTDRKVLEIRKKHVPRVVTCKNLAEEYGVSELNIHCILKRKTWKHI